MCLWFAQDLFTLVELCGFISATSPQRCGPNSAADRHAGLTGLQTSQGVRLKHKSLSVDRGLDVPRVELCICGTPLASPEKAKGGISPCESV